MKKVSLARQDKLRLQQSLSSWFERQRDILFCSGPLRKSFQIGLDDRGVYHCRLQLSTPVKHWTALEKSKEGWQEAFDRALECLSERSEWVSSSEF